MFLFYIIIFNSATFLSSASLKKSCTFYNFAITSGVLVNDVLPRGERRIVGADRSGVRHAPRGPLLGLYAIHHDIAGEPFGRPLPVRILTAIGEEEQFLVGDAAQVDATNDAVNTRGLSLANQHRRIARRHIGQAWSGRRHAGHRRNIGDGAYGVEVAPIRLREAAEPRFFWNLWGLIVFKNIKLFEASHFLCPNKFGHNPVSL
jgi:hypothetical protein